jgi:hypothetical protein
MKMTMITEADDLKEVISGLKQSIGDQTNCLKEMENRLSTLKKRDTFQSKVINLADEYKPDVKSFYYRVEWNDGNVYSGDYAPPVAKPVSVAVSVSARKRGRNPDDTCVYCGYTCVSNNIARFHNSRCKKAPKRRYSH